MIYDYLKLHQIVPFPTPETVQYSAFTENGLSVDTWLIKADKPYHQMVAYVTKADGTEILVGRHDLHGVSELNLHLHHKCLDWHRQLCNELMHGYADTHLLTALTVEDMADVRQLLDVPHHHDDLDDVECNVTHDLPWSDHVLRWDVRSERLTIGIYIQSVRFFTIDKETGNERSYLIKLPQTQEPYINISAIFNKQEAVIIETLGLGKVS